MYPNSIKSLGKKPQNPEQNKKPHTTNHTKKQQQQKNPEQAPRELRWKTEKFVQATNKRDILNIFPLFLK